MPPVLSLPEPLNGLDATLRPATEQLGSDCCFFLPVTFQPSDMTRRESPRATAPARSLPRGCHRLVTEPRGSQTRPCEDSADVRGAVSGDSRARGLAQGSGSPPSGAAELLSSRVLFIGTARLRGWRQPALGGGRASQCAEEPRSSRTGVSRPAPHATNQRATQFPEGLPSPGCSWFRVSAVSRGRGLRPQGAPWGRGLASWAGSPQPCRRHPGAVVPDCPLLSAHRSSRRCGLAA